MSYNMRALISRLNPTARTMLAEATNLCNASTHSSVEVQHYLARLAESDNSDATRIFRHYGVDTSRLGREMSASLDKLKRGASSVAMSESIMKM